MSELMFFRQLSGSDTWLHVACLGGLFALVIFRRESIVSWRLFKLSYVLLALSIIVPALLWPLGTIGGGIVRNMANSSIHSDQGLGTLLLLNGSGPTLLAFSIFCAFGAVMPKAIHELHRPLAP